jgi:hypothetical protein
LKTKQDLGRTVCLIEKLDLEKGAML